MAMAIHGQRAVQIAASGSSRRGHMSECDAAHYKDAEKIEGTLEIRMPDSFG